MAVTGSTGFSPRLERQIQTFDAIPVKESSRIEKYDRGCADKYDHSQVDPAPGLPGALGIRNAA